MRIPHDAAARGREEVIQHDDAVLVLDLRQLLSELAPPFGGRGDDGRADEQRTTARVQADMDRIPAGRPELLNCGQRAFEDVDAMRLSLPQMKTAAPGFLRAADEGDITNRPAYKRAASAVARVVCGRWLVTASVVRTSSSWGRGKIRLCPK